MLGKLILWFFANFLWTLILRIHTILTVHTALCKSINFGVSTIVFFKCGILASTNISVWVCSYNSYWNQYGIYTQTYCTNTPVVQTLLWFLFTLLKIQFYSTQSVCMQKCWLWSYVCWCNLMHAHISCTAYVKLYMLPWYCFLPHEDGATPLGKAAENGHFEIVQRLLEAGATINYQDKKVSTTSSIVSVITSISLLCILYWEVKK